jgi:hypothetical protein
LLHSHLKLFIAKHLVFSDDPRPADGVERLWVGVGVEPCVAANLVALGLRWSVGRLLVNTAWQEATDMIEQVSGLMLAIFQFRKFTDRRWVTVGESCRTLVASQCVGLEGLVRLVRSDPSAPDYYIHGFERLTTPWKKYAVIAAMSSRVADSFLMELLDDDRVARQTKVLRSTIAEELAWVAGVGAYSWSRLAPAIADNQDRRAAWGSADSDANRRRFR